MTSHRLLASSSGLVGAGSNPFDVAAAPIAATHPHEPPGFTPWTTLDGTLVPSLEDGWGTNSNGNLSTTPRVQFERAISTTIKIDYTGQVSGKGPVTTWKNLPIKSREVYVDFDYVMQSDYLAQSIFNKFMFWTMPTQGSNPILFGHDTNSHTTTARAAPVFHLQGAATYQGSGNTNPGGNRQISGATGGTQLQSIVTRDSIIRYEVYLKTNSPGDVADGIVRLWAGINGATPTLLIEATDVAFFGTGGKNVTNKFDNWKLAPTYGGTGPEIGAGFQRLGYSYGSYKA